ncbi:MAG TPA: hypothetical protein VM686_03445 [Polyangiaceae bacterium]|nr:hypothetical protein [Polyangiaceae bacterium]
MSKKVLAAAAAALLGACATPGAPGEVAYFAPADGDVEETAAVAAAPVPDQDAETGEPVLVRIADERATYAVMVDGEYYELEVPLSAIDVESFSRD